MAKIIRITVMLLSCLSLSILGTASSVSAHPRHVAPTPVVRHVVPTRGMHSNGDAWCC